MLTQQMASSGYMKRAIAVCLRCVLVALIAASVFMETACVRDQCVGYKKLSVREDLARFSLEYPCNWRRTRAETHPDGNSFYLTLSITGPDVEIDDSRPASAVWILFADWPSKETPNASVAMDDSLSSWDDLPIFKMIERSTVEIAGIQAEQAVFHSTTSADGVRVKERIPTIVRLYYFEYGGLIWSIYSSSVLAMAEENEMHFNHILETFQILD